jgi:hypothetical protein
MLNDDAFKPARFLLVNTFLYDFNSQWLRENMMDVFCIHVYKKNNKTCWNSS